ncbi:MAG: hypothetical protein JSV15_06180 [Candidatus Bathyarchaeota archaeon]|nr:MAG: hypothetical protein JSV15_06180 [Candidatus Bathyarchaeota archaeon]
MTIEKNLLRSILKLTKKGPIEKTLISRDAQTPTQIADDMLKDFSKAGFVQIRGKVIEASLNQRVKIAIHAIRLGADFESVCNLLEWNEFEKIAATTFEFNHFNVIKGLRFKGAGRRWEVDILGCREPIIVSADCKHWHQGWTKSAITKTIDAQINRTQALANVAPMLREKMGLADWKEGTLIPMVLSLFPAPLKFYRNTPVVPILQLQDFLNELPAHIDSMTHFFAYL